MKIRLHKIASSTLPCHIDREVEVSSDIDARVGSVIVVKALQEKAVYDKIELTTGRMAKVSRDDLIAGVLGRRRGLRGFVGDVPEKIVPGDRLHILNLGGVIGMCTSRNLDLGEPLWVEVIGTAVRDGRPLNIGDDALAPVEDLPDGPPLVIVAGTCMAAGKTRAACEIIAKLTARGFRLAAAKLTGVACLRDTLNMLDHGAIDAASFLDAGLPSTVGLTNLPQVTKALLVKLAPSSPDAVVIELGDGIIGGYGVRDILMDPQIRERTRAWVCCANDLVAAWGAVQQLRELGIRLDVMAGAATDNEVGSSYIGRELGIPAINARTDPHRLADVIERRLR